MTEASSKLGVAAVLATLALTATGARAATVSETVSFRATNFTTAAGSPTIPTDPVIGSFSITYDPTQTYTNSTSGISLNSLNINLGSALSFDFSPTGTAANELIVGGVSTGADTVTFGTNDFYLQIVNFPSTPAFQQLGYTTTANGYYYTTGTVGEAVTATPAVSAAPEPGAWMLMLGGVGMLGAFLRTRRGYRREDDAKAVASA